jgi:hypothetical protein
MDAIAKKSGGRNIVGRPQARPAWYAEATVDAQEVELFLQELDPDTGAYAGGPKLLGRFPAVGKVVIDRTPDSDRNFIIYAVPYAADNTPGYADVRHATQATVIFQRVTEAPTVTQVGASTADLVTVAVDAPDQRFVRKRRTTISANADMSDPSVTVREFGPGEVPRLLDIDRAAALVAAFTWTGEDPATHGFAKTGSGTTAASSSPAGWKITTSASDAATYYSKSSFPASPFAAGFTLELVPPTVNASDGAGLPNDSVMVRVDDGTKKYELRFSATEVYLNGGSAHAHAGAPVRLVVAAGGLTADLWVGETKVENDTAGAASTAAGLLFGDLAGADDSEAVWPSLAYALTPQDPFLAATIYVTVAHSGGGSFAPESDVATFTFASEVTGTGGSEGDGDLVPRDRYTYEPI